MIHRTAQRPDNWLSRPGSRRRRLWLVVAMIEMPKPHCHQLYSNVSARDSCRTAREKGEREEKESKWWLITGRMSVVMLTRKNPQTRRRRSHDVQEGRSDSIRSNFRRTLSPKQARPARCLKNHWSAQLKLSKNRECACPNNIYAFSTPSDPNSASQRKR